MKKIETLRQLQLVGIYIYKDLLKACEQNGIKLYLLGGTLIGAVRHGGFIPWDDDIDVCLSRPDYEKLLAATGGRISDKCRIIDPATDASYKGVVPVAIYENSAVISKQFKEDENLKISISIFIYDGAPEGRLAQWWYYTKLYTLRARHACCRADFKNVNTRAARLVGPLMAPFFNAKKVYKYKNKILRWQRKYPYETSRLVSTNTDSLSHKEVFPKYTFEESAQLLFEGIKSYTFANYHEQLTTYYGDYMQPPPEHAQKPKHSFDAQIEDDFSFEGIV